MSASMPTTEVDSNVATVNVAIAVIVKQQQVFISKRGNNVTLANFWEFPGGKVEPQESPEQALIRECQEEIGITPSNYRPLIQLNYLLNNKRLNLNVYKVSDYTGNAYGKEKQTTKWVKQTELSKINFPPINSIIINALLLPKEYAITKSLKGSEENYLKQIEANINHHQIKMLQFRSPQLNASQRRPLALKIKQICQQNNCIFILNGDVGEDAINLGFENIHLTSKQLKSISTQQVQQYKRVGASCHNKDELLMAQQKGCHFALLSPVHTTQSHPDAQPLGWKNFKIQIKNINMPVFALGGMAKKEGSIAQQNGAQGIAAIGAFYETT